MKVEYTNKEVMDKLNTVHTDIKIINNKMKTHSKLIYGAYTFTFALLIIVMGIPF